MFRIISIFLVVIFVTTGPFDLRAQEMDTNSTRIRPREQLGIIIFSGLGGGILGLSTLSFYGRPQDHLQNIAFGFAFGVIFGTIYTTYNAAKPRKATPYSLVNSNDKIYLSDMQPFTQEIRRRTNSEISFNVNFVSFKF